MTPQLPDDKPDLAVFRARLRYYLQQQIAYAQEGRELVARLAPDHVPCMRSRELLLWEIAEEMGLDVQEGP